MGYMAVVGALFAAQFDGWLAAALWVFAFTCALLVVFNE